MIEFLIVVGYLLQGAIWVAVGWELCDARSERGE